MTAIAILRPVLVTLAEGGRKPRKYYTIIWRGPLGECGATEILVEDVEAVAVSPAPRLADMTYEDIQQLREELDDA